MMFPKTTVFLLLPIFGLSYPTESTQDRNETSLKWTPCNLDFPPSHQQIVSAHGVPVLCATVQVPLDYTNNQNGKTIDLQLIKVEATEKPFKGSIIMNPGGPGLSGVDEISKKGPMYRDVFGGHFDVVGLDARGTGRTLPFTCLPSNNTSNTITRRNTNFTIPQSDMPSILASKAWDDAGVFVQSCADTEGNSDIARYLSTPFVARDLLNIVDALNEDGLLRFWGRSYSSVLGQTFAAMFPDRVGRILLDSIVRFDDYFSGQWLTANRDTEVTLLNFFKECVDAGPAICPLANYTGPDTTPKDLQNELANVFQELLDNPIIMPDWYQAVSQPWWQPGDITLYQELKYWILVSLYRPEQYMALFMLIDGALKRNWTDWLQPPAASSPENSTTPEIPWSLGQNNFHAIACSDSSFRADKPEDLYSLARAQAAQGSWSDVFAPQLWPCAQWKFLAAEQYLGPFTSINTSFPLLMVNSATDPITPLSGAWEASANFKGSRLLVHNGHGHGLMNHPSACTIKAIHDYFNNGTLPDVGTVLPPKHEA
ncbi:Alpha/Beta hydrolase protein [Pyrenochaeta sp. MPI-SDFR-AT-0127]|nr:Alpha/Beta hydrolase protein [Pyrenochaeta sp. MPI-SDFR-AT-0127]